MKKKTLKRRIQEQFWSFGHKAKDMAGVPGITYDLLVDDNIRVKIIEGEFMGAVVGDQDVIAREVRGEKMYLAVMGATVWMTQTEAFGKKKQA